MKKLINLTRHDVVLRQLGTVHKFPRSGKLVRVTETSSYILQDGLLYKEIGNQHLVGLPASNDEEIFIVSRVVAEFIRNRYPSRSSEIVFPDDLITENGQIIGCKSLGLLR